MHDPSHVPSSTDRLDLVAAARDLWPGGTLALWQGGGAPEPDRVWWPEDDASVLDVLVAAAALGRTVVPYGAGSGVCGGARGRPGAWVIDLKRFDAIGAVDPHTWTVEAGAGVNGQHLEDALNAAGFTLGHSPSSIMCSTVGGWAAARSAGQFSSRYGVFEDMVLGLDAVAPGIGAFHVGVPGAHSPLHKAPDAWLPLLLGSEGTLAVITRVRMRVRPMPTTRWLRGYRFADVDTALLAMRELMQGGLWPAVVRLYDPIDTLVGGKTRPKKEHAHGDRAWWKDWLGAVDALPEVRRRTLALPLALPGVLQRLAEGLATGCLVVVGWEGDTEVVHASAEVGHALLLTHGEDLGTEPGERWFASRHAISYKLMPVFERGGFADTMEIAARWSVLPTVYAAVRKAVSPHAFVMAHMSHVYPEGGCIYFSFAGKGDEATYKAVWDAALRAVASTGATTTHHHGVGTLKAEAVSREIGPAVAGWHALKSELDPEGCLNPGTVFVSVPESGPLPDRSLAPEDGLAWVEPHKPLEAGRDPRWGWSSLPSLPRWQRDAWQTGWIEVRGLVDGVPCAVGRGPRSASGPDLRAWVAQHGTEVCATIAVVDDSQPRWMGEAHVGSPWQVAQDLLRSDLRPDMMRVDAGVLRVGFRGPAAQAFGRLASSRVPGGLTPCAWQVLAKPIGPLIACDVHDPRVVHVTSEGAFRPREVTDA